jgi:hypothetical protein
MPTGGLYYGKTGFLIRMRYASNAQIGSLTSLNVKKPQLNRTPFVAGAGVNAMSYSERRALLRRAAPCNKTNGCYVPVSKMTYYQFLMTKYKA